MTKFCQFTVSVNEIGTRIDKFLEIKLLQSKIEISRSLIHKTFNKVKVNHKKRKKNYKLKLNDLVEYEYENLKNFLIKPEKIDFEILYEDKYLLVVNKPAGISVHPSIGRYSGTLLNGLLHKLDQNSFIEKNGIVNKDLNALIGYNYLKKKL